MRMVFWNELKGTTTGEPGNGVQVEQGRALCPGSLKNGDSDVIFAEFRDLWHSLKVPPDADILRSLASGTCILILPNVRH